MDAPQTGAAPENLVVIVTFIRSNGEGHRRISVWQG